MWRDGIAVSASHTVKMDEKVPVTLPGGESTVGTVIGRDSATDLVALRIDGAKAYVAAKAETDALKVGSLVLAVGRPGRDVAASFGIISAIGKGWRTWQGARIDRVFRLDLAVYDGFSGGPLVDASGAVLGVNNSALARGTRVAIVSASSRLRASLAAALRASPAFDVVAVAASLVKQHELSDDAALLIVSVADGSPAESAGIFVGDVLLEANGKSLSRPTDLLDALAGVSGGEQLRLKVLRGGAVKSVSVTPSDRGARQ